MPRPRVFYGFDPTWENRVEMVNHSGFQPYGLHCFWTKSERDRWVNEKMGYRQACSPSDLPPGFTRDDLREARADFIDELT